jgi:predicted RNase H-like HicB family nuclease
MIAGYVRAATNNATFEILEDGSIYGEIPPLRGVWSNAETVERAPAELVEVLEGWIALRLARNLAIPSIAGVEIGSPPDGGSLALDPRRS